MTLLPTYHFAPGTLIEYDKYSVVVAGSSKDGLIVWDRAFAGSDVPQYLVLEHPKVREIMGRIDTVVDETFSSNSAEEAVLAVEERFAIAAWEVATEKERNEALLKEAWCLASRAVLENGRWTETAISRKFDDIQADAFRRQRLLHRGRDRNGAFNAKTWSPKRISQFCGRYFGQLQPTAEALLNKKPSGNKNSTLSMIENKLLEKVCRSYLATSQPTVRSIEKRVRREFAKESAERLTNGLSPLGVPHRNTIYRRLNSIPKVDRVLGRKGLQETMKEFSPTQHGVRALKPGELIELDFWHGDVFTLREKSDFWELLSPDLQEKLASKEEKKKNKRKTQRLWLCAAIDVATRMILGAGIAETPNARTVIEVLDMITRDKSDVSLLSGCVMAWGQMTGLGTVIIDTGPEFFNGEIQAAILAMGGSYMYGRAAVPMDKPFIERFFGTLRTMFADELPGKTGYSPDCLIAYDKEGMAAFNSNVFRHLLIKFIVDFYPLQEHGGLMGNLPIEQWKTSARYGAVPAPTVRVRRAATGLKLKRKLTKEGIRILGIPFGDMKQFPKQIWGEGQTIDVCLDPTDMREVTAYHAGKVYQLENKRPDLAHHSVRTLMAAIEQMTATNPKDRSVYEYVLEKYAVWFEDKIATGIERHGLPSTELRQETLEWFENSYCMNLQIDANPETMMSTDMDVLLSGGSGPGIYTPESIDLEKSEYAKQKQSYAPLEGIQTDEGQPQPQREAPSETDLPRPFAAQQSGMSKSMNMAPRQKTPGGKFAGAPKGKGTFK